MPGDVSRTATTEIPQPDTPQPGIPQPRLRALAQVLRDTARDAGQLVEQIKATGFEVFEKSDGSVVTSADRASEDFIRERLSEVMTAFADILPSDTAFVGEESVEAGNIPDTSKGDFFITDPIDGTKNFVEGKRGVDIYTVNIALVLNSEPVLGVVHEPVTGDDFANLDLKTAVISVAGGPDIELKPGITHDTNGQELRRYHASCMSYADIMRGLKGRNRHRLSYEWDTAAQDAILRTAGGRFYLQETGEPLTYNKASEKFFNPPVIGWLEPGGPGAKTG